ncbi:hypothetical protein ACIQYW_16210 [Rhodococcus erythropolis]|uniref:hypothetical protein n=1 Tax=Rhodococcus baikonurensis TaxID=172041 RepID=UPI00262120A2|nr:hypothetical protein [uncultured Rhodococcus sp.]
MNDNTFKHGRSGYTNHGCRCDECNFATSEYQRMYRESQAAAIREQRREHRATNRESILERRRVNYRRNREEILASNRRWRESNTDYLDSYRQRNYAENRAVILERCRDYYASARPQVLSRIQSRERYTRGSAHRLGQQYSQADDLILLNPDLSSLEAALLLGRTVSAINQRRRRIRRALVTA